MNGHVEHALVRVNRYVETFVRRMLEEGPAALAGPSLTLANDLKQALERLNQNPIKSSNTVRQPAPVGEVRQQRHSGSG